MSQTQNKILLESNRLSTKAFNRVMPTAVETQPVKSAAKRGRPPKNSKALSFDN